MAQRLTESFINTSIPGAYPDTKVISKPVGVAVSGNIVIIGEAVGGAAARSIDLTNGDLVKDNFFTPDQASEVIAEYISGPIVDAFNALASPSSDTDITGSATRVYIAKSNIGTKASAAVAPTYGTLTDKNYGPDGQKYFYQITESDSEVAASVTSSAITVGDGTPLNNKSFTVRPNGGTGVVITLSGTKTDHDTLSKLAIELSIALLASGMSASATLIGITIQFIALSANAANALGYGRAFELIDSTPGDLVILGLAAGLAVSSQEPSVQVNINRQDNNTNEVSVASAEIAMYIGVVGTTGTLTISGNTLTTAVVGGPANLNIDLRQYSTIGDLCAYIANITGYTCSADSLSLQKSPLILDEVSAIGICSTGASLKPGRIKKANYNFITTLSISGALNFTSIATTGLPNVMTSYLYLSGGAKGGTIAANLVKIFTELEGVNVNFVIPLFSQDASVDFPLGLTETTSTYTIAAINALTKSHILKMSVAKFKKYRQGFCSVWDTFAGVKGTDVGVLANARFSLCFQKVSQVNSSGTIQTFYPWYASVIAAGMQAAGFYKAIVNKYANVISYVDPSDFDSASVGDQETALESGLLFLVQDNAGVKWVSDQTTYGVDTNFVYNSIQAMYAADLVALDLANSFQVAFTGKSLADVDASTALVFLGSKMNSYKTQKLIAASSDAPVGFKNASIKISGPIMKVKVEIKLATALYFIPIEISISEVTTTA